MADGIGKRISEPGALKVVAYPGDNMVLLAMSIKDGEVSLIDKNLAGFSIWRTVQGGSEEPLLNRLDFETQVTKDTQPHERKWTSSADAPFQKFRWVDVPPGGFTLPIAYRVVAKYFAGNGKALRSGPMATVTVDPPSRAHARFRIAFTRGYASSQAYAERFHNADIRPAGPKKAQFDTAPFSAQYEWLGADARKALMEFIDDCNKDNHARIDVFAYDLDEPDVIAAACRFGRERRLRAILDNAPLHTAAGAVEPKAARLIRTAAGAQNVRQGHFSRFQHNKVLIKRDAKGRAQKVLFGSMNFSLRGLYVQANNVIVVDDPAVAGYFADAFDNAFANDVKTSAFAKADVASGYKAISQINTADLPQSSVALSPHSAWTISLNPVASAIQNARSSVLYAVMEPKGSGPVLASLRLIAAKPTIFSYGTVETSTGLAVQSGNGAMGDVTSYTFLKSKVPAPFVQEWSGGAGKHIHHKFVVVDFNDSNPVVFTGSSNLAAGGEEANGDNLVMINDPTIASIYAIEAVRLFDHYSFRQRMQKATSKAPLTLWHPGKPGAPNPWWTAYYDPTNIKLRDRCLFAEVALPPGLETVKRVDWSSIGGAAPAKKRARTAKKKKR
jgi:phosphatidylserine/phosphatidylglycerophosphate/cardiolipin synthase-like enzyme